eukprot:GGOE01013432.1.p1 GENE.GGOE01013432.1~~GGOE01013432.1.p1  ORF type:complete len:1134 (+),score=292.86 GGOE01013432.1:137-3403(+)
MDNDLALNQENAELLVNVFETIAQNGKITLDQLPFVLVGAEVQASTKEIEEAIEQLMPDADEADALLDLQQVQLVHQQLLQNSAATQQALAAPQKDGAPSLGSRLIQWWRARCQRQKLNRTAYEKHMRPTTRLLLVILCTSCVICAAIVVVAIVLIWDFSTDNVLSYIKRDVDLVRDGINLFAWQTPVAQGNENSRQLASLVSLITNELGYKGSKETEKGLLEFQVRITAGVLDGWYEHGCLNRVTMNSLLIKGWLDLMLQNKNLSTTIAMFNVLNGNLPTGHEVVLSRTNITTGNPVFLTNFRFSSQCVGGKCGSDPNGAVPTKRALAGLTGTVFGIDYRPMPVVAGHTFLANTSIGIIGVVYKIDQSVLRLAFQDIAANLVNAGNDFSVQQRGDASSYEELVLATSNNSATQILSDISGCAASCVARANVSSSAVSLAVRNQSGVGEMVDLVGNPIVVAYTPLPMSGMGLSVSVRTRDFLSDQLPTFGAAITAANSNFNDTKEIQLAGFNTGPNASRSLTFYTTPKFGSACGSAGCVVNATTCPYMQKAATQCTNGNVESQDYRGSPVFVGYACASDIHTAVTVKNDESQRKEEGIALARTIVEYQNDVRFKDSTTEFLLARKKTGAVAIRDMRDFDRLTTLKHRSDCPNGVCTGFAFHTVLALRGQSGVLVGSDYRNVKVVGAYTYVDSLDVALVINVEAAEAEASSLSTAMQLAGCSVSTVFVGMLFLFVWTNRLLRSMDEAWDEGKRAIEREKEMFGEVIRAMYPPLVAKRLLAGETRIVYDVPRVTVFFSDIYEFTTASNAITPEELIQFMSYTFGVMDITAEHFHVHKVKTIGDAYLAVAGLPGCDSLTGTICLDMLLFASSCAQLFSHRYIHPEDGNVLTIVHDTLFGKKRSGKGSEELGSQLRRVPSKIGYGNPALPDAAAAGVELEVQCVMRYGVSNGPITAGILPGKVPLFDVWGKTVNLASRMESTGQPGRIQVSEGVHHTLLKVKDQPFTFDSRHKVSCKGLGQVFAYFLATARVPPPEELLARLGIEPNLGQFHFECGIPGLVPGTTGSHTPADRSSTGKQSARSSVVSEGLQP